MRATLIVCLLATLVMTQALAETLTPTNKGREGELFRLDERGRARQTQLVVLTSEHCPWSKKWLTKLADLQRLEPTLTVVRLEIDRPGSDRVDWSSPLAKQYEVRSLPQFLLVELGQAPVGGEPARAYALERLRKAKLFP